MDIEGVLAIVFLFGGGTLFLLAISPIGKAIADRIRARGPAGLPEEVRRELEESRSELVNEVQQLRVEIAELSERMDFTERLLARQRGAGAERIAPPNS